MTAPLHTSSTPSPWGPMDTEQIPYTPETRPSAKVVDFTRRAIERNKQRQNERDRKRLPRQPEPPEAA